MLQPVLGTGEQSLIIFNTNMISSFICGIETCDNNCSNLRPESTIEGTYNRTSECLLAVGLLRGLSTYARRDTTKPRVGQE